MEDSVNKANYNLSKLREIIARGSFTDLRIFCADLSESYEAIVGESSNTREAALAIVRYFDNRGRVSELITRVQQEFPSAEWDQVIQAPITGKAESSHESAIDSQISLKPVEDKSFSLRSLNTSLL